MNMFNGALSSRHFVRILLGDFKFVHFQLEFRKMHSVRILLGNFKFVHFQLKFCKMHFVTDLASHDASTRMHVEG